MADEPLFLEANGNHNVRSVIMDCYRGGSKRYDLVIAALGSANGLGHSLVSQGR